MPEKEEAIMAKYDVKFSCGHTETISLIGPVAERERKIKYFEEYGVCSECYKKQKEAEREKQNAENSQKASEYGMSELQGTPKQIAWANTIRVQTAKDIQEGIDLLDEEADPRTQKCLEAFLEEIGSETMASRIIDQRECLRRGAWKDRVQFCLKEIDAGRETPESYNASYGSIFVDALKAGIGEKEEEVEILVPEDKKSETLVRVTCGDDSVSIESQKDSGVINIAKSCGFRWDGAAWTMGIKYSTGTSADRAAEIANKLLLAGYQVSVPASIKDAAVAGKYEPRCTRWICKFNDDESNVYVTWDRDDDMYDRAENITGAKWAPHRGMRVPVSSADELEDFAKMNSFRISPGAREAIDKYRNSLKIVSPEPGAEAEKKDEKEGLEDILNSSREVIEDLKDED